MSIPWNIAWRYRWADGTTYEVYKAPQIWEMSTIVAFFLRVLQGGGRTGAGTEPKIIPQTRSPKSQLFDP